MGHHPDFHHPSPQHGHMGMAGMHSSPTKMHPAGGTQGHHGHQAGAPYHWSHGAEMPIPGAAGGSRGENMPLDTSGMQSTIYFFKYPNLQKKIFQKTILNLKFKFPTKNTSLLLARNLNFKLRIVFLEYFFLEIWRFEK